MTTSQVRVLAIWEDDPTECPLTVDVRIDFESRRVVGRWSLFGAVDVSGPACAPFVLQPDGAITFGVDDPHRRAWRTDLRDCAIRVGEHFTLYWNEQDFAVYRIEKVAVLGSKEN